MALEARPRKKKSFFSDENLLGGVTNFFWWFFSATISLASTIKEQYPAWLAAWLAVAFK
jgi:hypothetical protein